MRFVRRGGIIAIFIEYNKKSDNRKEQEKSLGCQDRYQALEHKILPLSLGQHKAKTQPSQLANMIADDSRFPHSSFNSSHPLSMIPINSTHLAPYRPTNQEKKQNLSRYGASSFSSSSTFSSAEFDLCQIHIGTHTWGG